MSIAAFQATGLVPAHHAVQVLSSRPEWDYTTVLNLAFLALAAVMAYRFLTTGGPDMLRMMGAAPEQAHPHSHSH